MVCDNADMKKCPKALQQAQPLLFMSQEAQGGSLATTTHGKQRNFSVAVLWAVLLHCSLTCGRDMTKHNCRLRERYEVTTAGVLVPSFYFQLIK